VAHLQSVKGSWLGGIDTQSWAGPIWVALLCCLCMTGVAYAERQLNGPEPWRSAEWRAALRYRPALMGGSLSEVVSPSFFFSEGGARDPQGEWEASVSLLLQALSGAGDERHEDTTFSALCARPDRFLVIARSMGEEGQLDATMEALCPEHSRWAGLASQGLAWTHSGPSFTRPESSLGHASLWLKSSEGLEHALTFGAHLNDPFDRLWALLGVATGDWTLSPYRGFERVYRELEERGVTRLTLSDAKGGGGSAQARRMLGHHLKSLRGVSLTYSFVGNNCATQTARLLDVASSLAGEHDRHPRPERWGLAPLEAAEERGPFVQELAHLPSLSEELASLSERLSDDERHASSLLLMAVKRYINQASAPALKLPTQGAPLAWRVALLTLEVERSSELIPPPRNQKEGVKARVWQARQALLLGLSEASERAHLSGELTAESGEPPPALIAPDRLRLQLLSALHMARWPDLPRALQWGLSLWSTPLSAPEADARQRLFLLGPRLWGEGLSAPQGGRLISLWSLGALNGPVPRLSWRITMGAGAHELEAPFELAWLKGGLGAAIRSSTLKLRAWAHLGGRAALASGDDHDPLTAVMTPSLSLGARGALGALFGWSLEARVGLPERTDVGSGRWGSLASEPPFIQLHTRVTLTSWLRALIWARALPLNSDDPLQAWVGLEL